MSIRECLLQLDANSGSNLDLKDALATLEKFKQSIIEEGCKDTLRLNWLNDQDGAISSCGSGDYRYYFGPPFQDARITIDLAINQTT
jgi:hypothetical protein